MNDLLSHALSGLAGAAIAGGLSLAGPVGRAWLKALLEGKGQEARIWAMLQALRAQLGNLSDSPDSEPQP